jgi:hypothetical protein
MEGSRCKYQGPVKSHRKTTNGLSDFTTNYQKPKKTKYMILIFFFFLIWPYIVQDLCKEICTNIDPKEQENKREE